ncbi:hypothetical protein ILUMI_16255 [Ignelater luminosus]|uniref:Uncharacterized protein n=1 Tax=Ignelater luminosus TaxID=2038154 RepID=A0A8K0G949_IGNLU|nr:hypothetical protein ILUMI_16255 [Ignelater luminosus]
MGVDGSEDVVGEDKTDRGTRKRKPVSKVLRLKKQEKHYAGSNINLDHFTPTCKHSNSNNTKFKSLDVPKKVLLSQKQKIYANTIKVQQDNRVSQLMQNGAQMKKSQGGKCKDKFIEKRQSVIKFTGLFKARESHYSRRFGTPFTDVCSYCERLNNKIKQANDANIHRVRAKQFNLLMKEEDADTTTFCFDLQQIQNLPKIPIQKAYYSLQIAFYSFCIVDINAKEPIFYT